MGASGNRDCQWASPECLERFHRGCVDYLSRQFVPKWDSLNGERELVTSPHLENIIMP